MQTLQQASGPLQSENGNSRPREIPLPAHIVARLAAEGVHSLADWRRLGRRRHQFFGITRRVVEQLDALVREVP